MTTEERNALFMKHIGLVGWTFETYFRHRRFSHAGEIKDMLQTGYLALLESLQTYDPERGKPSIYCGNAIRYAMLELVGKGGVICRKSRLRHLSLPETIKQWLAAYNPISLSGRYDNEVRRGQLTRHPREPEDQAAGRRQKEFEEELDQATLAEQATTFLLRFLKPRWQKIIMAYYQLGSLTEVGQQFGISKERVRQIVTSALYKMRLELDRLEQALPLRELMRKGR